jgi:hypothetical protein
MKRFKLILPFIATVCAGLLSLAFTYTPDSGDPCGVFAIGTQKVDLSKGENMMTLPSKDLLIEGLQSGITFTGTADCGRTYTIVGMNLHIATAKEEVSYDYDFDMISKMQSMESYMLTRYFNDAVSLHFTDIRVADRWGEVMDVPDVTVLLSH